MKNTVLNAPLELPNKGLQGQGFGRRAAAWVIDTVIYYILVVVATLLTLVAAELVVALLLPNAQLVDRDSDGWVTNGLSALLFVLYFAAFEWLYGATPGKVILGMRVVSEDGRPLQVLAPIIRGVLRFVDSILFGLPAYASMGSSTLRQRLGDKAAHTVVVRKDDPLIVELRPAAYFVLAFALALIFIGIFVLIFTLLGSELQG